VHLNDQRHNQQRHNVDDLDERVDRRASGVFVGVTHGITRHGSLVCLGSLATMVTVFDIFFGVVPGATTSTH